MRKYLASAALAAIVVSTPAVARDGSGYIGVEAGVVLPRASDADVFVNYSSVNVPGVVGTPEPADTGFTNAINLDAKTGYSLGIYGGYDFGMFRVEGEIDWKHANLDDLSIDNSLAANLEDNLNLPGVVGSDFDLDEAVGALSFMLNGLVDFGDQDGLSFQAGGGFGWTKVKLIDDKDGAFA